MTAELGNIFLSLALCVAITQVWVPLLGASTNKANWMQLARTGSYLNWGLVLSAYLLLTYAFVTHDYSIKYVANHSNNAQPLVYLISGVWGAHEGSLLLWILMLTSWSALVAKFSARIPLNMISRVLAVLGLITIGFLTFTLFTSNPFERLFPVPLDGRELNPLLQDLGLIFHPPTLYMGYVGMSVVFAFAIAAMLHGKLDTAWARWARPWTSIAWLFLTMGITLGSWWAYYELGWGGWWFWDPVENASLMPWLVGTALIHSLAVTEKRGALKAWTILLSILAFSLSLLGTFLVRSGIITSVHSFASDPARGLYILIFLLLIIGGSLLIYSIRAHKLISPVSFSFFSKEALLLINNILLVVFTLTVLYGTLRPLIVDALSGQKISVGPPYFNFMFILLMAPLAIIIGVGVMSRWKQDELHRFFTTGIIFLLVCLSLSVLITYHLSNTHFSWQGFAGLCLAIWIIVWSLHAIYERLKYQKNRWQALRRTPASIWGMSVAHIGIAVFIIGVTHISTYSIETDIKMTPNQSYDIANYTVVFNGVSTINKDNYQAQQGQFEVKKQNSQYSNPIILNPEKRFYSSNKPMTEAAIQSRLHRDIYISLGEDLGNGNWSVRLYYKSFVACIWLGGLLMALGALLSVFDKRFSNKRLSKN